MFTLPFASYFGSQYVLREQFPKIVEENLFLSVLIPVASAVITVWIVIAFYAYRAFCEEINVEEDDANKED